MFLVYTKELGIAFVKGFIYIISFNLLVMGS